MPSFVSDSATCPLFSTKKSHLFKLKFFVLSEKDFKIYAVFVD
jgi:hypothetical protein